VIIPIYCISALTVTLPYLLVLNSQYLLCAAFFNDNTANEVDATKTNDNDNDIHYEDASVTAVGGRVTS
jgi:hypothetical protein